LYETAKITLPGKLGTDIQKVLNKVEL